jgi:hypothetical protein
MGYAAKRVPASEAKWARSVRPRSESIDIEQHAGRGPHYEKLDQLATELLLGIR